LILTEVASIVLAAEQSLSIVCRTAASKLVGDIDPRSEELRMLARKKCAKSWTETFSLFQLTFIPKL
jgi:hypothetical protein